PDPTDPAWRTVRVAPRLWNVVAPRRPAVASELETAVRNLPQPPFRGPDAPPAERPVVGARTDVGPHVWAPAEAAASRPVDLRPAGIAADAPAGGSTLSAENLVKVYRKRKVVNEVDLRVSQGEIVGLLGPNGAGKTTTFYIIVGLIVPDGGKVFLD